MPIDIADEYEEAREEFHLKAQASWASFQEAGRRVTGDEVAELLRGWAATKNALFQPATLLSDKDSDRPDR